MDREELSAYHSMENKTKESWYFSEDGGRSLSMPIVINENNNRHYYAVFDCVDCVRSFCLQYTREVDRDSERKKNMLVFFFTDDFRRACSALPDNPLTQLGK